MVPLREKRTVFFFFLVLISCLVLRWKHAESVEVVD